MTTCPYAGEAPPGLATMEQADVYAQQLIDKPEATDEIYDEVTDWADDLYRLPARRNADKAAYDRVRLRRYVGSAAFLSVVDMERSRRVELLQQGDYAVNLEALGDDCRKPLDYLCPLSDPVRDFSERLAGVFRRSWDVTVDGCTGSDPALPYGTLVERLREQQPEFQAARLRYDGISVSKEWESFKDGLSEDNAGGVLDQILSLSAMAPVGVQTTRQQGDFLRDHILLMGALASVDRTTNFKVASLDRDTFDGFPESPMIREYESAVIEGRPINPEYSIFEAANDGSLSEINYKHPALRDGPFQPHRMCPGYVFLNGPDGVRRSPVATGLLLGSLIAETTLFAHWPGVRAPHW